MVVEDPITVEYKRAIAVAMNAGDNDKALELSIGLKQYIESYQ